jgi:uncharacterized protein YegL
MIRRFLPLLLLCPLLLTLPAGAGAEESFSELEESYKDAITHDLEVEARIALVERVAAFDDRNGAKTLVESLSALSGRLDALLKTLLKLDERHEELNTNQDVAQDEYQTRDELRRQIMALDEVIVSHRTVMERIFKALVAFQSEKARAAVCVAANHGDDWRERAIAAQAAASYPTVEGRKAALKALKDKEPRVVIRTLYGLRDRKDPETVTGILDTLKLKVWVIHVAAAEALAQIGAKQAVRPLIELLPKTEGRVQSDINESLKKLTGQNFEPDYEEWKRWYEDHLSEFEGDEGKPLARDRGRKADEDDSSYYGIKSKSKRIVYVLDISGSMLKPIGGGGVSTPREGEEERPSGPKIEIAKNELKNAIRRLPEDAYFNLITYNHLVKKWEDKMVKATQANKNKSYLFIRSLKASGSTFTYGALKEAFKLAGMGATDPNYKSGVDTIFLLSDGAPTDQSFPMGKLMEPEKILTAVQQWNKLSKIVIHAIAIDVNTQGSSFIRFMKLLAEQNGGKYIERG